MKDITDLIANDEVNKEVVVDVEHTSLPPVVAGPTFNPACFATLALDLHGGHINSTRSLQGEIRTQRLPFYALIADVFSPVYEPRRNGRKEGALHRFVWKSRNVFKIIVAGDKTSFRP